MRHWVIVLAALFAVNLARAEDEKPADKKPAKERDETFIHQSLVDKLGLTDEQKAKLKDLRAEFDKDRDAWMDAHKAEREELRKEIDDAKTAGDKTREADARKKWLALFRPLGDLRRDYMDKFKATLTDDQKETLQKAIAERKAEHKEKKEKADQPDKTDKPDKD